MPCNIVMSCDLPKFLSGTKWYRYCIRWDTSRSRRQEPGCSPGSGCWSHLMFWCLSLNGCDTQEVCCGDLTHVPQLILGRPAPVRGQPGSRAFYAGFWLMKICLLNFATVIVSLTIVIHFDLFCRASNNFAIIKIFLIPVGCSC